jgi:hypothetical protein
MISKLSLLSFMTIDFAEAIQSFNALEVNTSVEECCQEGAESERRKTCS